MRIYQIMAGAGEGGAETYFTDLVLALQRAGLEQRIAIRSGSAQAELLRRAGLSMLELPFGGVLDWRTRVELKRNFRDWKPDIVQTWMNRATRHCPRGSFFHVGWLGGYYARKYFKRCNHVVAVTSDIVRYLREEGDWMLDNSHYIPTFAQHEDVAPVDRSSLKTPGDVPLIVALGRLHTKKAFDILLQALIQIPIAHLWLAGDGPLRQELGRLAQNLGLLDRVHFLGWRKDRSALLLAADVVVMPSRYEPFGTVMIEAWAARKPLVVAASVGPQGLVRDGRDALLVPIDNPLQLAGAIQRILDDPVLSESLAESGHAVWKECFTEAAVVSQYFDFYKRIRASL